MLLDLRSLYEAVVTGDTILVSVADGTPASEFVALTVNPLVPAVFDGVGESDQVRVEIPMSVVVADADAASEQVTAQIPMGAVVFDADGAIEVVSGGILIPVLTVDGVTPVEAVSLVLSSGVLVPGVQVVATDTLAVGERRSVLRAGYEEALFRHGGVAHARAINGAVETAGHLLEAVDQ